MTDNKPYPDLPKPVASSGYFPVYSSHQMRAYVDADRAMRAAEAETVASQWDNLRPDLIAALREVFDTSGPETPQAVRDVVEYTDSWLNAYIQKRLGISVQPQEAAPNFDVEKLITSCIPGGSSCDPQQIADEIRRYCNAWPDTAPAAPSQNAEDSARLDWLIEQRAYVVSDPDACPGYWIHWKRDDGSTWVQSKEYASPRLAIDAAQAKEGGAV